MNFTIPYAPKGDAIFDFYSPLTQKPIGVISIPHSGQQIPEEFKEFLTDDIRALDEDVDYKVHELVDIEKLRKAGLFVMVAHIHRTCIDLNRSMDKTVFAWTNNSQGTPLVLKQPDEEAKNRFLSKYYHPYYETLRSIIDGLIPYNEKNSTNPVSFIDLHSMPSKPTAYHLKTNPNQATQRPDFCLSDQYGKSCTKEFIEFSNQQFIDLGYAPKINDPYVGGNITQWAERFPINNIQIEISRALYMDEVKRELHGDKVEVLKENLTNALISIFKNFE